MIELLDCHDRPLRVGDYIAYATAPRIWVGTITSLFECMDGNETIYKIQINTDEGDGTSSLRAFEHLGWKIYKIKGIDFK